MSEDLLRNQSISVGTTAVLLSMSHPRKDIVITNTSTGGENITISVGKQAVAGQGVFLTPYSVWFSTKAADYDPPSQEIWAICSGAGGTVGIYERV